MSDGFIPAEHTDPNPVNSWGIAFNPFGSSGSPRQTLSAIEIEGLWGIASGNGFLNQPVSTLFFASGPDGEEHGLYGRLDVIP